MGNARVAEMLETADLTRVAATQRIRPPYRPVALAKLDQRTKEARLMRETRAALVAHVGGKPSAVQSAMIERACQLTLRIVAMDRKFAETGAQTDHDSRTYLAWSNSLTRTLAQLGLQNAAAERDPTIGDLLGMPSRPAQPAPGPTQENPRSDALAPATAK